jgi:membrane protein required for colicin V production
MSTADIGLSVFILIGAYSGYKQGFLLSLFSLLGVFLGVLGGFKLMGWAMLLLADRFNVDQKVLPYFAFGVVFVGIVIVVSLVGRMIKLSLDKSFLGRVDEAAGAVLGIVQTIFMLSVALWLLDSLKVNMEPWSKDSWLYPRVAVFAPTATNWVARLIPIFEDVF